MFHLLAPKCAPNCCSRPQITVSPKATKCDRLTPSRARLLWFAVTRNPSAEWLAQVGSDHRHADSFGTAPSLCADMIFGKEVRLGSHTSATAYALRLSGGCQVYQGPRSLQDSYRATPWGCRVVPLRRRHAVKAYVQSLATHGSDKKFKRHHGAPDSQCAIKTGRDALAKMCRVAPPKIICRNRLWV